MFILLILGIVSASYEVPFQGSEAFVEGNNFCYFLMPGNCYGTEFYTLPGFNLCPVVNMECVGAYVDNLVFNILMDKNECIDYRAPRGCRINSKIFNEGVCEIIYTCGSGNHHERCGIGKIQVLPLYYENEIPVYPYPQSQCNYIVPHSDETFLWMECLSSQVELMGTCKNHQCILDIAHYGKSENIIRRSTYCNTPSCTVVYSFI